MVWIIISRRKPGVSASNLIDDLRLADVFEISQMACKIDGSLMFKSKGGEVYAVKKAR